MTKKEILGLIHNFRGDTKTLKELNPILEAITELAASGGNVQSDWSQSDSSKEDYIKHKPLFPALTVEDITALTAVQLDALKPGDAVAKVTGNQKHTYIVSYKGEGAGEGICLSYNAAGYGETVSYDRTENGWAFNSTDIVPVPALLQETGQSTTATMSQKAVTDIIGDVETLLAAI